VSSALDKHLYSYAGWIPSANSRLSFRHIGESRHPTESKYANLTTASQRIVVAYQRRPLSDVLFSGLLHRIFGLEGDFWFVFTGASVGVPGHADALSGSVFVFKSKDDWRAKGEPKIRPTIQRLNLLVHARNNGRDDEIGSRAQRCTMDLQESADIEIEYYLYRTGEIYFRRPKFSDSELHTESTSFAQIHGHDLSKWLADQAYFFVRDIAHTHQHHVRSSDTILILQDLEDDVSWRRKTIFAIYYYIIRSKRFSDARSMHQAMGILGYCKSFKGICRERYPDDEQLDIPPFNDLALEQSIIARANEIAVLDAQNLAAATISMTRSANLRMFALAIVAIFTALFAMFVQPLVGHQNLPKLTALAHEIGQNGLTIVALLSLALIVVWALTQNDWQVQTRFGRDVLELSNFSRIWSIATYLILAGAILVLAIYFSEPALSDLWGMIKDFRKLW
jgi:hypothetical protein